MMSKNPEVHQPTVSLAEAERLLLGALIKASLRNAIAKAEDESEPIDPKIKERLIGYFAHLDKKTNIQDTYKAYCLAWEEKRKGPLPEWEELKEQILGKKGKNVKQKIINPLYEIYIHIKGKEPDPSEPWLGRLVIEGTEEVCSLLSQFGLNPEELVKEVHGYLDSKL